MRSLDYYAAHAASLFPILAGQKGPWGIVESFKHDHSNEPAQWALWQVAHPGCNFGVVAFASNWIIVDIDVKPANGQTAEAARVEAWGLWDALCKVWGLPGALAPHVHSANGGFHVYFAVPPHIDPLTLRQPAAIKGRIDIRVVGYTVAAGSHFEARPYLLADKAPPPHPAPQALLDHCAPPKPSERVLKVGDYDFEDAKKLYEWMRDNDAIQGDDDWRTAGMAARLEFGDRGKELWEILATRSGGLNTQSLNRWKSFDTEPAAGCVTLGSVFDIAHKANWKGSVHRTDYFKDMPEQTGPGMPTVNSGEVPTQPAYPTPQTDDEFPAPAGGFIKRLGERLKNFVMPDYLWDGILQKRFCYSLTAQTGTGKTALGMLISAHVATGRPLCGLDVDRGSVIYLAAENPTDVDMRWFGLCQTLSLDPDTLDVHVIEGVVPLSKVADQIRAECEAKGLQPSLIVVDTSAAFFEGEDDNGNVAQGEHARRLRTLCTLPGGPCVLILAHPVKGAKDVNEMVPRGGGAFLNEVDGNIGLARGDGGLIGAQSVGKFRGPAFEPLHFALHTIRDHPRLVDRKGKQRATVVCMPVSEAGAAAIGAAGEQNDIRLLRDIEAHPGDTLRKRGERLGCHHETVSRRIEKLTRRKLIDDSGLAVRLTTKGQKELNALDVARQAATEAGHFPLPAGT